MLFEQCLSQHHCNTPHRDNDSHMGKQYAQQVATVDAANNKKKVQTKWVIWTGASTSCSVLVTAAAHCDIPCPLLTTVMHLPHITPLPMATHDR
jgi:hypothetical protein